MPVILFEQQDAVATLTLNRPEKLNAFNREMALQLRTALDECAFSSTIRSVLITGAGKGFSAGQDLAEAVAPNGPGLKNILSQQLNPLVTSIRRLQKPVIVAVNGVAAGAGANIALCGDIVVAAASASFTQAFSKIGLIPDSGGTHVLPRLIGWQKASALMMLGESIPATEAERIGMIYKVYPDQLLIGEAQKIALSLAQMPTRALALTKRALNFSMTNNLDDQLQLEDDLQAMAGASRDFAEGVAAFMEKRKPLFTGE